MTRNAVSIKIYQMEGKGFYMNERRVYEPETICCGFDPLSSEPDTRCWDWPNNNTFWTRDLEATYLIGITRRHSMTAGRRRKCYL